MKHTTDGATVFITSRPIDPQVFLNFRDNTSGLTDAAIVDQVRFVRPDPKDPDMPRDALHQDQVLAAQKTQALVAVWPDQVWAVLFFPISQRKPRRKQLIRAYSNAQRMQQAMRLHALEVEGSKS
jgi:hypothetical protein